MILYNSRISSNQFIALAQTSGDQVVTVYRIGNEQKFQNFPDFRIKKTDQLIESIFLYAYMVYKTHNRMIG